ncbi:MAG: iron hydrogenase [Patescibacteria group bacterium]
MNNPLSTSLGLSKAQGLVATKFIALLGVATFLPMFIHSQWLTGPIVNAILFLAVAIVGVREALLIALVPSSVALAYGLLPTPLAPMVPFIMMSNALLIWIFDILRSRNYWLAVVVASVAKFVWLYAIVHLLMKSLLSAKLLESVAVLMSWPQLFSALLGGAIAWVVLRWLKFEK